MRKNAILKTYLFIGYAIIAFIFIFINYNNIIKENLNLTIKILLYTSLMFIVLILLNKFIVNKLSNKVIYILIIFFIMLFLLLQIFSLMYFQVEHNGDIEEIIKAAKQLSFLKKTDNLYYFKMYPNNVGCLIIILTIIKSFVSFEKGMYIVNILSILLAQVITIITAKKIGGYKLAINTAILGILFAPFYLYTPIIYTDTLSVAFPIMTILFWSLAKENKETKVKKYYLYWILLTLSSLIGYLIKPITIIIYVSIIIENLFVEKKCLKAMIISLSLIILLNLVYDTIVYKNFLKDDRHNDSRMPYTHWIMMGLSTPKEENGTSRGWGSFSREDYKITYSQSTYDGKEKVNLFFIKYRLQEFGIIGYMNFLKNKLEYTWNDSSFDVLYKIEWDTKDVNTLPYKIVLGEKSEDIFVPYLNSYYLLLTIGILTTIISDAVKNRLQVLRILENSVIGVVIFLLMWEAWPRYIYCIFPILIILGAYGVKEISNLNIKNNFKKCNKDVIKK